MVLVTGPEASTLKRIVRTLVEERLIACGSLVDGATSIYRWQGEVQEDTECLGLLKTTAGRIPDLERRLRELHPYDVPEFIVLPLTGGSADYLDWVRAST